MKNIIFSNVTYELPYTGTILDDVTFSIETDEFVGLLGQNGAGKTTILDLITGLKPVTIGEIKVLGEDPFSSDRNNKSKVGFLAHNSTINLTLTVAEFLKFHGQFYPAYSLKKEKELLELFGINPAIKMGSLSTGQQIRAQIIALVCTLPQVLIIDEITAVLDPNGRKLLFEVLKDYKQQTSCSIILATNIAEDLMGVTDKILFLQDKKLNQVSDTELERLYSAKRSG
jgi:ABC-2 type transport system ATP-binding protein